MQSAWGQLEAQKVSSEKWDGYIVPLWRACEMMNSVSIHATQYMRAPRVLHHPSRHDYIFFTLNLKSQEFIMVM